MGSTVTKDKSGKSGRRASNAPNALERYTWRNWYSLCGIAVAVTIGLTASLAFSLWPWTNLEVTVLSALALAFAAYLSHLTGRQKHAFDLRNQMQDLRSRTSEYRYNRLYELLTVPRLLDSKGDPASIFKSIPTVCLQIFNCEKASLMLLNESGSHLEVHSAAGYTDGKIIGSIQRVGDGIAGWVAKNRKPLVLQKGIDASQYPGLKFKSRGILAAIVVPMILGDKLLGVLSMSTRSPKVYYDDEDLRALEAMAGNVAVCVGQALRAKRMNKLIADQKKAFQESHTETAPV